MQKAHSEEYASCGIIFLLLWLVLDRSPNRLFLDVDKADFFIAASNAETHEFDVRDKAGSRVKMNARRLHI